MLLPGSLGTGARGRGGISTRRQCWHPVLRTRVNGFRCGWSIVFGRDHPAKFLIITASFRGRLSRFERCAFKAPMPSLWREAAGRQRAPVARCAHIFIKKNLAMKQLRHSGREGHR